MGYAVSYKPTKTRARRQTPATKAQRTKDIKDAIRWNVARLEHDTVSRSLVIQLLHLNQIAPTADPTGDHVMQQLIKDGIVLRPSKRTGVQVFGREDLINSLKAWVGMK